MKSEPELRSSLFFESVVAPADIRSIHCLIQTYGSDKYMLLTSDKTFAIFNFRKELHNDIFLDLPEITNSITLVMPLAFGRNHRCLVIADIENQVFIYIDPNKSTSAKTNVKKMEFIKNL